MLGFDIVGLGTIIGSIILTVIFLFLAFRKSELSDFEEKENRKDKHGLKPVH